MSCFFMMFKKRCRNCSLCSSLPPFSVTNHLFLIRVKISGAVSPVRVGGIHHRQVSNASQTAHPGQLRASNRANMQKAGCEHFPNTQRKPEVATGNLLLVRGLGLTLSAVSWRQQNLSLLSSSKAAIKSFLTLKCMDRFCYRTETAAI